MGRLRSISKYRPSIFQTSLDFSNARKSMTLTAQHPYESAFLRSLMLILLVLCAGYLYFVGASVLNIIAKKEAVTETTRLLSSIAQMEQEYFALSHSVDESIATSIGLTTLRETQYVYQPSTAVAATIPGNGI